MIRNMGASDKYHEDFVKRSFHRLSRGAAQFSLLHNTARLSPVRSLALSISLLSPNRAQSPRLPAGWRLSTLSAFTWLIHTKTACPFTVNAAILLFSALKPCRENLDYESEG